MLGSVGRRHLIDHLGVRLQGDETVGKADRHQDLVPFLGRDFRTDPLAVGRRAMADVDGDVEDPAAHNPQQLVLSEWRKLEMQAAQHPRCRRQRVVVLHEIQMKVGCFERRFAVGLGEESAMVPELLGPDDLYVGNRERIDLHASASGMSMKCGRL